MHKAFDQSVVGRVRVVVAVILGILLLSVLTVVLGVRIKTFLQPKHLQPAVLEAKYALQFQRIRQLAQDWGADGPRWSPDQSVSNMGIFSLPEILEARVQSGSHSWRVVSEKSFRFESGQAWFTQEPSLESPAVNTYRYKHLDGSTTRVAEYSNIMEDKAGVRRQYTVLFDVNAMPDS
jgi:hypothetical protein